MQVHGHRGCRGLMPENTLKAFQLALELGVDTLEMDVCISKDLQVVVSHEPWFSHEFCTPPDGSIIDEHNETFFKLYQLNYTEIKRFDCGLKTHPRFPLQHKTASYKPLLSEVIALAEAYSKQTIHYNIEIKYTRDGDQIFHPDLITFSNLLLDLLQKEKIRERTIVQCFDTDVLQYIHKTYPKQRLSYLVEYPGFVSEHLAKLDFTPEVYSPDYTFLNAEEIKKCHEKGMQVIPWTVNEEYDMKQLIQMGVDGIITDYPDRLIKIIKSSSSQTIRSF